MNVVLITEAQANELKGKELFKGNYYNPFKINNQWFISVEEQLNTDIEWLKNCEIVNIETDDSRS